MLGPAVALWAESARGSPIGWIGLAGAAPLIVIIVLTQSRGAFLAVATMALPSAIALARRRPRAVMAFAALVTLALYLAPGTFWKRIGGLRRGTSVETTGVRDPEGSARRQFAVVQTALSINPDHPTPGVGLGVYGAAQAHHTPALRQLDTHN